MRPRVHAAALAVFTILLSVVPCPVDAHQASVPHEVAKDQAFNAWLNDLTQAISQDPRYRRIPLDTDSQVAEFSIALHRLFRGQTGGAEFMQWVDARYPGHEHESATIIRLLHAYWRGAGRPG